MMIGRLKQRVTIEKPIRTPDGAGGFTETWQKIAASPEIYAAIAPLSGGEQLRYHQLQSTVTHRIILRHRSDVTAAMRIVKDATVYEITAVTARGEAYLEILAVMKAL